MMNRTFSTMMTSAVVLGSLMVGCSSGGQDRPKLTANDSQSAAPKVERMLAEKDYDGALAAAEQLVATAPQNADARAMLGRAYLANGRYISARTAFSDALTLGNREPRTIISLALCESGLGNLDAARTLLSSHIADLPAGDYGLAMAMAGDAREGVRALLEAANSPDATVKTRQNLAYALAMGGAWGQARLIAGQDLSAREAEARIGEWTQALSQSTPTDRVVAMLGVAPRADDTGLPTQLALNTTPETPVQLASAADLIQEAAKPAEAAPAPVVATPAAAQAAPVAVAAAPAAKPAFAPEALAAILAKAPPAAPRSAPTVLEPVALPSQQASPTLIPAVQQAPAAPIDILKAAFVAKPASVAKLSAAPAIAPVQQAPKTAFYQPSTTAAVKPAAHANWAAAFGKPAPAAKASSWVVQVGAFNSDNIAHEQWRRLSSDRDTLKSFRAVHSVFQLNGKTFYRLAIGGFGDRGAAATACGALRTSGQDCFVRLDDNARQARAGTPAPQAATERASGRTRASR